MFRGCITLSTLALVGLLLLATPILAADKIQVATFYPQSDWETVWKPQIEAAMAAADVEIEHFTLSHSGFTDQVVLLAGAGQLPDVLLIPPERVAPIVHGGFLENLDPWIQRTAGFDQKTWLPGAKSAIRFESKTFGLPAYVVNYTFAYNKDILASRGIVPPQLSDWVSWGQIETIARKATEDQNGDGTPEIWGFHNGTGFVHLLPLMRQAGGKVYDDNMMVRFDTPAMNEAVDWLLNLVREGLHPPGRQPFWQGKAAAENFGSWEIKYVERAETSIGVASGMHQVEKGGVAYVTTWAMSATSKNKEAAWRFMSELTSKDSQTMVAARGLVPMRRDAQLPPDRRELLTGLMNSLEYAESYPYHVESNFIEKAFSDALQPVFAGEEPVKTTLQETERTVNAYLSEIMSD